MANPLILSLVRLLVLALPLWFAEAGRATPVDHSSTPLPLATAPASDEFTNEMLQQSWIAYKQRFIQPDGRVIDWEQGGRSTSEGQAYAMLRSVFTDDPATFDLALQWAENNLQRRNGNTRSDQLWAWKWGQQEQNGEPSWGILDNNFASDADVDAITALILASRRWNRPDYLQLAQAKLKDLWAIATIEVRPTAAPQPQTRRYLIPGELNTFQPQPNVVYLNPSYFAPYAYRLFAQIDRDRDWLGMIDSGYWALEASSQVSLVGLPSDWVALNTETGRFSAVPVTTSLRSMYSFDAFRVWWRLSLDATWFNEPRATAFLKKRLQPLQALWQSQQAIPARITLLGTPIASYEATSQYAMLYAAFQIVDPAIAEQIRQQKLMPTYKDGIWDNNSAYYVQNLAWFGLFPPSEVAASLLSPAG
ncbi:glycosyl hydrolase [Phormidium tenue FACHB-886]|nr:glycosyl hydrolase [Phormidium tenue FACHB-886]